MHLVTFAINVFASWRRSTDLPRFIGLAMAIPLVSVDIERADCGGGPENVLLLVNSNSMSSRTIANHYIALRQIPSSNVVYIDWHGSIEYCPVQRFRREILVPAVSAIRERKLDMQIDCVAYSTSFPWGENFIMISKI